MAFDWFWKAMGSSPKKNQKKSRAVVAQADPSRYSGLSDAELRDAASDVVTEQSTSEDGHHFGGQVDDAPALLAILSLIHI